MENIFLILIFISSFSAITNVYSSGLPPRLCLNLQGENYKRCLKTVGNQLKKAVLKELKVKTIDPVVIPIYSSEKALSSETNFKYTIRNATIHGFNHLKFTNLDFDPQKLTIKIGLSIPSLNVTSAFEVKGQYQTLPLNINGTFTANINKINLIFDSPLKSSGKGKARSYTFDDIKVQSAVGDCTISLTADDPKKQLAASYVEAQFNNNAQKIINDNNVLINDTLRKAFEQIMQPLLKEIRAS